MDKFRKIVQLVLIWGMPVVGGIWLSVDFIRFLPYYFLDDPITTLPDYLEFSFAFIMVFLFIWGGAYWIGRGLHWLFSKSIND